MNPPAECDIVIVCYFSSQDLERCLPTVLNRSSGVVGKVILVDNQSLDGTKNVIERYAASDKRILFIENEKNLGFSRANNIGLAECSAEFVLFLNPDTELPANVLETLLKEIRQTSKNGIIGPQLVFDDGRPQSGYGTRPTVLTIMRDFLLSGKIRARLKKSPALKQRHIVDWVSGACLLGRRYLFNQLGGFDEKIFMYSEDVDLCLRAKSAGYQVIYDPRVTVVHFGGKSRDSNPAKALLSNIRARLYFIQKYDRWPNRFVLGLFFFVFLLFRLLIFALLSFQARQRRYFVAHLKVLVHYVFCIKSM
ncbi:glycosyltransferase family 2 protein [candidate division KSB1 bacterium]|nr:glycosyltransferase family 2 protein [candidate division KSB1 bacterium]